MPKQTKTSQKKKVVSSKTNGRRVSTPLGILIVLLAGLFLAVAGTYGYTKLKERDLQAKANRWKSIVPFAATRNNGDGVKYVACREYIDIGPDAQQGKRIKVSVLASKPKTLKGDFYTNMAGFGVSVYRQANPKTYQGGKYAKVTAIWERNNAAETAYKKNGLATSWWNGELTSFQVQALAGDKIVPTVYSQKGNSTTYVAGVNAFSYPLIKNSSFDRIIYTPSAVGDYALKSASTLKSYNDSIKNWQKQAISVTQLPNCN
jgi:hypothetical protein